MHEPVNRTILLFDVEGFSRRDNVVQGVLRRTLTSVVDRTLVAAGVEPNGQYREDRGDGLIVLLGGDVAKTDVLRALLTCTPDLLHEHNRLASRSAQMRLRIVLAAGEIAHDPQRGTPGGVVGHDLNQAFRLLDSNALRGALKERVGEGCVLMVSEAVYDGVIRHGHRGVRPELFRRTDVHVKDGELPAWLHQGQGAPGPDGPPTDPGEAKPTRPAQPPAAPPTPQERPAGAVFTFHAAPVVHGSIVGGDQHGVSGGQVTGDVILGGSAGGRDDDGQAS